MKRMAIAVTSALIVPCAIASDWVYVAHMSENSTVLIDRQSIRPAGDKLKAWILYNYSELQKNPFLSYDDTKKYKSTKQLYYFNCRERTSVPVQFAFYDDELGNGKGVYSLSLDPLKVTYSDVIPDTIGESLINLVCKYAPPDAPKNKK